MIDHALELWIVFPPFICLKIYRNFIKVYKVLSNKRHQIKPRLALFKTTLSSMYPTNCKQINKLFINNLELKADFQPVLNTLEFVYDFCFVSCKKSQNVAFRIYLITWGKFKLYVNRHVRREALRFILLIYHLMKTFTAVKINEAVGKRVWKVSRIRYVILNK